MNKQKNIIDGILTRGVEQIIPSRKSLEKLISTRKITLYQGFDPTAASLHIGHLIGIRKLAQFQKLGHKVIFLIGDFTGRIGDPTDKKASRIRLTKKEVLQNLSDYKKEVKRVIDFDGSNAAEIKFNSKWLSRLTFEELIELSANITVQQLIERSMFQSRIKREKPIYLHEFFYPIMQGYDSVVMNVDLEIGGSDQLFNMLIGRNLMKKLSAKDKHVLTVKLLADSTGGKMSKSEGSTIFLAESPEDIFGKVMSWSDEFIDPSIELLTDWPLNFAKNKNPINVKKQIATEIVKQIYGNKKAQKALKYFEKTFQNRNPDYKKGVKNLSNIVTTLGQIIKSKSEVKRLIQQGGICVNKRKVTNQSHKLSAGDNVKVGKRVFIKIQ